MNVNLFSNILNHLIYIMSQHHDVFIASNIDKKFFPNNTPTLFKNLLSETLQNRIRLSQTCHVAIQRIYTYKLNTDKFLVGLKGVDQSELGCTENSAVVSCHKSFSEGTFSSRENNENSYGFSPPQFHVINLNHQSVFSIEITDWHGKVIGFDENSIVILHITLKLNSTMSHIQKSFFLTLENNDPYQFKSEHLNNAMRLTNEDKVGIASIILPAIPNIRNPYNKIEFQFLKWEKEDEMHYRESIYYRKYYAGGAWFLRGRWGTEYSHKYDGADLVTIILPALHYKTSQEIVNALNTCVSDTFINSDRFKLNKNREVIFFSLSEKNEIKITNNTDLAIQVSMHENLSKILELNKKILLDSAIDNLLEDTIGGQRIHNDQIPSEILGKSIQDLNCFSPKFLAVCSPIVTESYIGSDLHQILDLFLLPKEEDDQTYCLTFPHVKFTSCSPGIFNRFQCVLFDPFTGPIDFGENKVNISISFFLK